MTVHRYCATDSVNSCRCRSLPFPEVKLVNGQAQRCLVAGFNTQKLKRSMHMKQCTLIGFFRLASEQCCAGSDFSISFNEAFMANIKS